MRSWLVGKVVTEVVRWLNGTVEQVGDWSFLGWIQPHWKDLGGWCWSEASLFFHSSQFQLNASLPFKVELWVAFDFDLLWNKDGSQELQVCVVSLWPVSPWDRPTFSASFFSESLTQGRRCVTVPVAEPMTNCRSWRRVSGNLWVSAIGPLHHCIVTVENVPIARPAHTNGCCVSLFRTLSPLTRILGNHSSGTGRGAWWEPVPPLNLPRGTW